MLISYTKVYFNPFSHTFFSLKQKSEKFGFWLIMKNEDGWKKKIWNFFIRSRDMDGYECSQFVGRHFPSFTNVANSGKNCKKRLILFSSNPRKKTTSWQRFWKFEPWKMMTTRQISGRGGGGLSNLFPLPYFTYFPQMRASNLKFTTNFPLYRRGGGTGGKKGHSPPPQLVSHLIRSLITVF